MPRRRTTGLPATPQQPLHHAVTATETPPHTSYQDIHTAIPPTPARGQLEGMEHQLSKPEVGGAKPPPLAISARP